MEEKNNEITVEDAAKNLEQYLKITVPELPASIRRSNRIWSVREVIYKTIEQFLDKFTSSTETASEKTVERAVPEKYEDALLIMYYTGLALDEQIYLADSVDNDLEITKRGKGWAEEIKITPESFEKYLTLSVLKGNQALIGRYWITLKDVQTPEIINPEFTGKAVEWLKREVYSRIVNGEECFFLQRRIKIKQDHEGFIYLGLGHKSEK